MKKLLIAFSVLFSVLAASAWASKSTKEISPYPLGERSVLSERAIAERIKPVGNVCVEGEECGSAAEVVASAPKSGDEVYGSSCIACHGSGAAGAPKLGDKAAWSPRIAQGEDTLLNHALNGFNMMPPKGTCMACSDDEIRAAVEYMVNQSQ